MATQSAPAWVSSQELGASSEPVRWPIGADLPPFVPQAEILVHPGRISRLATLGGFEPVVTIDGDYRPPAKQTTSRSRANETPPIACVSTGQTAVGGLSLSLRGEVRPQVGSTDNAYRELVESCFPSFDRQQLRVSLNVPAMQENLARKGAVRDADAWAALLDKEIRRQMGRAATHLLVKNELLSTLTYQASSTLWSEVLHWTADVDRLRSYATFQALSVLSSSIAWLTLRKKRPENHYSFLYPQFDRLAAAHALSHLYAGRIIRTAE